MQGRPRGEVGIDQPIATLGDPRRIAEARLASRDVPPSLAVSRFITMPVMSMTTSATGLSYEDTRPGTGPVPKKGQICVMHYTGWLWENGKKGAKFDSSVDRDEPFEFP